MLFALTTGEADKALGAPQRESFAPARSPIWSQSRPQASRTRSSIGLRALWFSALGASPPSEASPPRRSRKWWLPDRSDRNPRGFRLQTYVAIVQ